MAKNSRSVRKYTKFNLSESESDIKVLVDEYRDRIKKQLETEEAGKKNVFLSFSEKSLNNIDLHWLRDNQDRFFKNTPNYEADKIYYLSEIGFICCMIYSADGSHVIVGHSSGLIQMRHGSTGTVLCTLRNMQFPPKPVYALQYSKKEERICYAACTDGAIYRIEIPNIVADADDPPVFCIRADPALECLHLQYFGTPGISSHSTPFITSTTNSSPALCFGLTAEETNVVVGYGDTSVRVFNKETLQVEHTFKVHKLRMQFIPKKLLRVHFNQVCALKCHDEKPYLFASGSWDETLRIWDIRCPVGCVMTFEGVNVCSDAIDLKRDLCIAGSWQPTEALSVWDLTARKRLSIIRVQNRRPDVDGEYIYACRFWNSTQYNRKGKYAIIGGSGTNCVEVINLHNRYITCSYPTVGTVLAVASYQDRIAFGGTAPVFNMVSFHDPKHESYDTEMEPDYDYTKGSVMFYEDSEFSGSDV